MQTLTDLTCPQQESTFNKCWRGNAAYNKELQSFACPLAVAIKGSSKKTREGLSECAKSQERGLAAARQGGNAERCAGWRFATQ